MDLLRAAADALADSAGVSRGGREGMYIYIYSAHALTHTCTHTHMRTHRAYTHIHMQACTCTRAHAHTQARDGVAKRVESDSEDKRELYKKTFAKIYDHC